MNRKLFYTFSLLIFMLMWGMFGSATAAPRSESDLRATAPPVETTPDVQSTTESQGIPVTAKPEPVLTEILVFYGLIGLTALFLILALLSIANKSTAPFVEHNTPPSDHTEGQ
jgi:hypothetical protein